MITRIREVRRARKLTLQDVAHRCVPPTTPQTIGRLETGTRTVSVTWLNRIAAAIGVDASDLVRLPLKDDIQIVALLAGEGVRAPGRQRVALPPQPAPGRIAVSVESSVGEYRAGDEIWCDRLNPDQFPSALNRDVLLPRPNGRFLFGRLIGHEKGTLHLLPLGTGQRQLVLTSTPWAAVAVKLIRNL